MKYVGIHEVIECNKQLEKEKFPYKLHLRDACGRQSFWLEPLVQEVEETTEEKMFDFVKHFFSERGFELLFSKDSKYDFWI